jgi:hypothetical protein
METNTISFKTSLEYATNLLFKYIIIIDGDNVINKVKNWLLKIEIFTDIGVYIFVNATTAKSKYLKDLSKIFIVNTEIDGGDNVDLAITLFCGKITNKNIVIITEDHFGVNLMRLLNFTNNIYSILPHELENKYKETDVINIFNKDNHSLQTLWRNKWMQSANRFAEKFDIEKVLFKKWVSNEVSQHEIEKIVTNFLFHESLKEKTELIIFDTDDELREFYKNNWSDTHANFCRQYKINKNNFSRWLLGKCISDVSSQAVYLYKNTLL